jgi:hypothetical protein
MNDRAEIARLIRLENRFIRETEGEIERAEASTSLLRDVWLATLRIDLAAHTSRRDALIRREQQLIGVIK